MKRIIANPSKYIQGADVLSEIGDELKFLVSSSNHRDAFIMGGTISLKVSKDKLLRSLEDAKIRVVKMEDGVNTCTWNEINRLIGIVRETPSEIIIGVGGGSALDTAKAVAAQDGKKLVNVPVIASNDAPCSAVSVVYDNEGHFLESIIHPQNPNLVVADTRIIANAPTRFLVEGMGDALATRFEAEAAFKSLSKTRTGGRTTYTALNLARLCYDNLINYGKEAKIACQQNAVTPALEKIVETNILLSGIGFESGGLGAAHAIEKAFTRVASLKVPHGKTVAFGTLVHLVQEGRPSKLIEEVIDFCKKVGLPTTLQDLGLKCNEEKREEIIKKMSIEACVEGSIIYNEPVEITEELVRDAILTADAWGQEYKDLDENQN